MIITICASYAFLDKIIEIKNILKERGHEVYIPTIEDVDDEFKLKKEKEDFKGDLMKVHFQKIEMSDAILVLNYDKEEKKNYIGGNTFLEMGKAFDAELPIFIMNPVPDIHYKDEIAAMKPVVLNGKWEIMEEVLKNPPNKSYY